MTDKTEQDFRNAWKRIKVSTIHWAVRRKMALHLDHHSSESNWQSLAEKFGLDYLAIQSIENRVCYTTHKSCTMLLFHEYLDHMDLNLYKLVASLLAIQNQACVTVLMKAFQNGELFNMKKNKDKDVQQKPVKKVFMTYSKDSVRLAKKICRWLQRIGCDVCPDFYVNQMLCEDRLGYYDRAYSEADYVVMLISPLYADNCMKAGDDEVSRTVCYIHSQMRGEYFKNQCRNKRFIPIMAPGALDEHVPSWLRHNTIFYAWPNHYSDIYARVHDLLNTSARLVQHTPVVVTSTTL